MENNTTRQNILGVYVNAIDLPIALTKLEKWISIQSPNYICVTPAHSVMDCHNDPGLKKIFNDSGMTTPDGMAIVWLLKMYGHKQADRVYGPDLLKAVCDLGAEKGWRHFFYGGDVGIAEKLAVRLLQQFPGLKVAGTYSPPFRELTLEEKNEVRLRIQETSPDIVWVGISSPKQERWMSEFVELLNGPVLIGVGAAFDFISGTKPQASRWVQRSGFEWLFRLLSEPRRLWPRYSQYPKFVLLALGQYFGFIDFDSGDQGV